MTPTRKILAGIGALMLLILLYIVSVNTTIAPSRQAEGNGTSTLPISGYPGQVSTTSPGQAAPSKESECTTRGGTWNQTYKECAGVNEPTCTTIGGTYNACASACRHNTDPNMACIQMCVPVCTVK